MWFQTESLDCPGCEKRTMSKNRVQGMKGCREATGADAKFNVTSFPQRERKHSKFVADEFDEFSTGNARRASCVSGDVVRGWLN